jgi:hypothetical protein
MIQRLLVASSCLYKMVFVVDRYSYSYILPLHPPGTLKPTKLELLAQRIKNVLTGWG